MAQDNKPDTRERTAEKLATQAETGPGRSTARPGPGPSSDSAREPGGVRPPLEPGSIGTQAESTGGASTGVNPGGGPSLSGMPTDDAYPGGGGVAEHESGVQERTPSDAKS